MRQLLNILADSFGSSLSKKRDYLDMFIELRTGPEEWFRCEFLRKMLEIRNLKVESTNQALAGTKERPDFRIKWKKKTRLIELKVLPTGVNYGNPNQRFAASKNNRKDFTHLENSDRDAIIYVFWPDIDAWLKCEESLEFNYDVECFRSDRFGLINGEIVLSYWVPCNA
jgi:hypothetical protein